ncbi:MAG: MFS transporter [Bacteroidota bacterium]
MINLKSKIVNAWAFYDWANSVYSLVITSTIFPIYYIQVTRTGNSDIVSFFGINFVNTELYAYAVSVSFLLVAVISPLLSSIADYTGSKKGFMQFFTYLGAFSCIALFWFAGTNIEFGIIAFILASMGYSGSIVFYNAFLPEIAEPKDHDRISAKGYAYGYIGSIILLIFNLLMIKNPVWFCITDPELPSKISFLSVGIWWIGFSQITFSKLPGNIYNRKPEGNYLFNGYKKLGFVWKQLKELKSLKIFLFAFFFYIAGLQTVMYMAANFGKKELELDTDLLIITIMIIQIVGVIGAYLFSYLSKLTGNINALIISICIWVGICIGVYFVYGSTGFIIVAAFAGLVMGGMQALSRSTYSKMLPQTQDHASYFSFYDVMAKLATVLGTACYGYIEAFTGSMRNSVLILITFFLMGFILLICIRNQRITKCSPSSLRVNSACRWR